MFGNIPLHARDLPGPSTYSLFPPCIKHIVSILGRIECCKLYYKYVNNDDKLKSIVLTANGEEPNPYTILTTTSMFSTLIGGLCDSGVPWDTSCIFVHIIC